MVKRYDVLLTRDDESGWYGVEVPDLPGCYSQGRTRDEALANIRPPAWPSPLFRYLRRTLPSMDVLSAADGLEQQTEARAVIGVDLLHRGERTAAIEHLRWARDHGLDRSIARDLARETLRRIETAAPRE